MSAYQAPTFRQLQSLRRRIDDQFVYGDMSCAVWSWQTQVVTRMIWSDTYPVKASF